MRLGQLKYTGPISMYKILYLPTDTFVSRWSIFYDFPESYNEPPLSFTSKTAAKQYLRQHCNKDTIKLYTIIKHN